MGPSRENSIHLAAAASTPLLTPEEYRLVVESWNRTEAPYPADRTIHGLFAEQAARTPHAVALVCGAEVIRYGELQARAERLARHLVRLGVEPEARVGVCMPRGPELVVAVLAALTAGAAYLPLDPAYPAERMRWMLEDAGATVLLTRGGAAEALDAPAGVAVVDVDALAQNEGAEPSSPKPERGLGAGSLAYVIYTSGSTGRPKGVAVEHRGVVRLVRGAGYAEFRPDDVILQTAPVSFDASTLELWGTLLNGGRLVILPGAAPTLGEIGRALQDHAVTTVWTTAGLLQVLVEERLEALAGVRQLLAGGDVLPVEAVKKVRRRFPALRLVNGYGPTENTTLTTAHTVEERWRGGPVPIGGPISNTTVYVLDGELCPVPVGEAGELYTGGAGVARGYLGRPAATADRFVPDPFAAKPGARLYRTGDRVRWRTDGTLDFLGRVDQQVKVRGFRVEPGEIEAAIGEIPGVAACAVAAREDEAAGKRLVAYVAGTVEAEAVRVVLRGRLPEHLLPDAVVRMDALPLTLNGKIDRRALPTPAFGAPDDAAPEAPRTETEAALARIWCDVLGVDAVGVDEPFYALGGHSLLGMRVLARISDAFGVAIPPRALLGSGTVREIAARIESAAPAPSSASSAPPPRADRSQPLPLSHAQEGAWFFEQLAPGSRAYRSQAVIRLRGPLDVPALERALGEIVRRHEIFRTVFTAADGTPRQQVQPPWPVRLPVADLSPLDQVAREGAADRIVRDAFLQPIDPAALPLVRWHLVRLADEEHRLAMVEHHFVHDGWSFGIFLRELRAIYLAFLDGRPSPLPDPPVQFADFAVWQRGWMETEAARAQLRYWEQALAGAPPLNLPTDRPRPAVLRFTGASERGRLPAGLAAEARAFGRARGATFFATLLAAFQAVLGRWSGQRDFCVGSALGSRGQSWMEGIVGMMVNTVALRADLRGDPTGAELLRRVRETALRAYENQDVPYDQVVRRVRPERTTSALPLYQVSFSFHDSRMADPRWGPLRVELAEAQSNGSAKVDLSVIVIPRAEQGIAGEDEVEMVWEYDTDLFDAATVRRMIGHFQVLLASLVRAPYLPLSRLEMMDGEERRLAVEEWNRTDADHPAHLCIHQLFEAQAARTPDAAALIHEAESLTYRALNERANRLAHRLVALGVGPEVRVGVCLRRGPELPVALLAVLKAGGAYVPLDPAYPAERLALTLADAAAPVIVTQDSLRASLPAPGGAALVRVDGEAAAIAAESSGDPRTAVSPRNLAYLIYTSGSTGTPKGIAIEHASAVAMLAWAWSAYSAEELGGMLASTSVCFDISVFELFAPLTRGGRVILVENALALPRSAAADQVRLVDVVPSAAAALLKIGGIPPGVRTMNLAGEPLSAELVDALYALGVDRVYDLYGPSEDTTFSTFSLRRRGGPVTIGGPLANKRGYVLDDALRPVPVGVEGELYLGGRGVTRGYLGRPGLTAERYVPDHLGGEPGARLYRTGDRVRRRADGLLEYRGRWDAQVKIRGFRVEPGEIEAALRRHPAVADCAVVAREDVPGDRRLVAYVAGDADGESLRAHLRGVLPDHMVPSAFVVLAALPLTPNGKVNRLALPAPDLAAAEAAPAAPETPEERALAAIWAGVLGVERVGVNQNFFDLGGHSLLLAELQARLEKALGREVPLVELFRHPTVRSFHTAQSARRAAPSAAARGQERGAARRAAFTPR